MMSNHMTHFFYTEIGYQLVVNPDQIFLITITIHVQ